MTPSEIAQLRKIVTLAQALIEKAGGARKGSSDKRSRNGGVRIRRSGNELLAFRKQLKAERRAGVPVAAIAKKHGVSASYIYQLD